MGSLAAIDTELTTLQALGGILYIGLVTGGFIFMRWFYSRPAGKELMQSAMPFGRRLVTDARMRQLQRIMTFGVVLGIIGLISLLIQLILSLF